MRVILGAVMTRRKMQSIFCIEGEWSSRLEDGRSVRPLLETLHQVGQIDFAYRQIDSLDGLSMMLKRWTQKQYARYGVGYIALHGDPGQVWVGKHCVSLEELGEMLGGRCSGRILYFGSCGTLNVEQERVDAFRKATGARAVVGYRGDIDWLESAAFELLLLESLTYYQRPDAMRNYLEGEHKQFCERLGLVFHYGRPR